MSVGVEAEPDWSAPGAFEIVPGIYRIPLPLPMDGLRAVNVYAVESDDGLVMVDGGWAIAEARERLEASLGTIGRKVADVRRFLVTHVHRDHYTQAVAIRREVGSEVSLGCGERESLELTIKGEARGGAQMLTLERAGAKQIAEQVGAGGFGDYSTANWEWPDVWLEGGERLSIRDDCVLDVLHTPGHTKGHVIYTDAAAGVTFSGDHVLPHITPSIGFESVSGRLPLADYLSSLRLVLDLPDRAMLPAHGGPADSIHARAGELLAHHDARLEMCLAAVRSSGSTALDVAKGMSWTGRGRRFDDLDELNQMLATCETVAHLDLLVADGRLGFGWRGEIQVFAP